jgi:hypothetical protein
VDGKAELNDHEIGALELLGQNLSVIRAEPEAAASGLLALVAEVRRLHKELAKARR